MMSGSVDVVSPSTPVIKREKDNKLQMSDGRKMTTIADDVNIIIKDRNSILINQQL